MPDVIHRTVPTWEHIQAALSRRSPALLLADLIWDTAIAAGLRVEWIPGKGTDVLLRDHVDIPYLKRLIRSHIDAGDLLVMETTELTAKGQRAPVAARSKSKVYILRDTFADICAKHAADVSEKDAKRVREQAERIVLDRYASEVAGEIERLTNGIDADVCVCRHRWANHSFHGCRTPKCPCFRSGGDRSTNS